MITALPLVTFDEAGVTWTACLREEDRVNVPTGYTLVFARDRGVGGTRRVCWPASAAVLEAVAFASPAEVEERLRAEFRRAVALRSQGRTPGCANGESPAGSEVGR